VHAGEGFPVRVNALLGASRASAIEGTLRKLEALQSMEGGPDIVTDLSLTRGSPANDVWRCVARDTPFVAATVPVYFVGSDRGKLDAQRLLDTATEQMENGVGLITIHPTPTADLIALASKRLIPCTSRGGGRVIRDVVVRRRSSGNAYLDIMDELVLVAKCTSTVISVGASFRPACIFDALDEAHKREIVTQGIIAREISSNGVGAIIEGPGHCRPADIRRAARLMRELSVPVMTLGPLPLDSAVGQDHIGGAIGAVLLGLEGCAHILSTVTRDEHTGGVPSLAATLEAVACARVAGRIVDIELLGDDERDRRISLRRAQTKSCVIERGRPGCARCGRDCPLCSVNHLGEDHPSTSD
jgi:phosphomethylpyrimidine synthase